MKYKISITEILSFILQNLINMMPKPKIGFVTFEVYLLSPATRKSMRNRLIKSKYKAKAPIIANFWLV